ANYGYPYSFVSRQSEAVPTHIVQLETGGLLAGLMQARLYLAQCERGYERNVGIHRMSPEAQSFVYKTWLRAMRDRSIEVREHYGYDPEIFRAASYDSWFVDKTEPHPDSGYEPASRTEKVMKQIFVNI